MWSLQSRVCSLGHHRSKSEVVDKSEFVDGAMSSALYAARKVDGHVITCLR